MAGHDLCEQGVLQVSDEKTPKPSEATGTAALMPGWSHGHRDVSGGWLRPTVFGAVDGLVTNASLISRPEPGQARSRSPALTGTPMVSPGGGAGGAVRSG